MDTRGIRLRAVRSGDEEAIHRLLSDERVIREGMLREGLRIQGTWRDAFLYAVLAAEWKSTRGSDQAT